MGITQLMAAWLRREVMGSSWSRLPDYCTEVDCMGTPHTLALDPPPKEQKNNNIKKLSRLAVQEKCSRQGSHCPAHRSGRGNMSWAEGLVTADPDVPALHVLVLSSKQSGGKENSKQLLPPPNPETELPKNPAKPPGVAPPPFSLVISPATHPWPGPFQWNVVTLIYIFCFLKYW